MLFQSSFKKMSSRFTCLSSNIPNKHVFLKKVYGKHNPLLCTKIINSYVGTYFLVAFKHLIGNANITKNTYRCDGSVRKTK